MAAQELKDRIYAKSNSSSVAQKLGTWADVAKAAGYADPFFPDADLIYDVTAALWKAKYRSVDSYLAAARQEMIVQQGSIPDAILIPVSYTHLRAHET